MDQYTEFTTLYSWKSVTMIGSHSVDTSRFSNVWRSYPLQKGIYQNLATLNFSFITLISDDYPNADLW